MKFLAVILFASSALAQATRPIADGEKLIQLGSRGVRIHDPSSVVKSGDEYWVFGTGRGLRAYRSKDLKTWTAAPRVIENAPAWVREAVPENRFGNDFWAPDVIQIGGKYLLYYSVSSFGKNTSAIALMSNVTLDPDDAKYAWKDEGIVIRSQRGDDFNAIDPAITLDAEGRLWMSFGSFWSGIKMIELDAKTGRRIAADSVVYSLARSKEIEAPAIHRHGDHYYLFVNWGICCRGERSTYNIRVGRAKTITGPYLDKDGKDMKEGGGTLLLEREGAFVGPGHASILRQGERDVLVCHFYDASNRGQGTLAIRELMWGEDGWPKVGMGAK
jgi:arabinan endo-1,5-alpha-L-arabinosidase